MGIDPKCAVELDHHDGDEAIKENSHGADRGDVLARVEGVGESQVG